jgi:hypothetical protein
MSVSGRQVALAVQAMLQTATARSCGYGTAPTSTSLPTGNTIPYCVLYELGQTSGIHSVPGPRVVSGAAYDGLPVETLSSISGTFLGSTSVPADGN